MIMMSAKIQKIMMGKPVRLKTDGLFYWLRTWEDVRMEITDKMR